MAALRITKLIGTCIGVCVATAGVTAVQLNTSPDFTWADAFNDLPGWLDTAPNPWLLITTALTAGTGILGAWAAIAQLRAPDPQSKDDADKKHAQTKRSVELLGAHSQKSFTAAKEERHGQHVEVLDGQAATREEIAKLRKQISELTQEFAATRPDQAAGFAEAAENLISSGNEGDIERAREVAEGRSEDAADQLMSEVHAGKVRNAERARQAARLYAPTTPGKAKEAYEEAVNLDPSDFRSWIELGYLREAYDTLEMAELAFKNGQQQAKTDYDRMLVAIAIGNMFKNRGDLERSRENYEAALAVAEVLASDAPDDANIQVHLAGCCNSIGRLELMLADLSSAKIFGERAMAIASKVEAQKPANPALQRELESAHFYLAQVYSGIGDLKKAKESAKKSLELMEELIRSEPDIIAHKIQLFRSRINLGDIEIRLGDDEDGRDRHRKSLEIIQKFADDDPENLVWQRELSLVFDRLGSAAKALNDLATAKSYFESGLRITSMLCKADPNNALWRRDLFVSYGSLGDVAKESGEFEIALANFRNAQQEISRLATAQPDQLRHRNDLDNIRRRIRRVEKMQDDPS